jgi:hypothetical protein
VEWLVMKAFALGLIRGTIDQVQEVVSIQWIQPRVLSIEQVQKMKDRMNTWTNEIKSKFSCLTNQTEEITVIFILLLIYFSNRQFVFLQFCRRKFFNSLIHFIFLLDVLLVLENQLASEVIS